MAHYLNGLLIHVAPTNAQTGWIGTRTLCGRPTGMGTVHRGAGEVTVDCPGCAAAFGAGKSYVVVTF